MGHIIGIIAAIVIFLIVVSLHELGHMLVAKACGVGVVEYAIGMGPVLFHKRFKDTVFSIRAIPFGGYCAMVGEESLEATGKDKEDNKKPKKQLNYKTDWSEDQQLSSKKWWQKALICVAGPFMNLVIVVFASLCVILVAGVAGHPAVTEVMDGYPAEMSGIQVGDVIVGVDDRSVLTWNDYVEYLSTHPKSTASGYDIHISRDGELMTIRAEQNDEDGLFGISIEQTEAEMTFRNVMVYTGNEFEYMYRAIFDSLRMLFSGEASLSDMSGVIGVTAFVAETVEENISALQSVVVFLFFILAFLSANLCIINLMPLPALDGGRIVLAFIEGLIRRPIPKRIEYAINGVGMILLLLLLGWTMVHDLIQTIGKMIV